MELKIKAQIDTVNKTIKLEENINLNDLFKAVSVLFPKDFWKEFTLEVNSIINWTNPIIIERPYSPWNPYNPYDPVPWITYDGTGEKDNFQLNQGVYSVDLNVK